MPNTSLTLQHYIDAPVETVYAFASNPENLARWASGLCQSIERTDAGWLAQTPLGHAIIVFAPTNAYHVLDHTVRFENGMAVYVPMRVVANGAGSDVMLTLFRQPGMTDEHYEADIDWVKRDLDRLDGAVLASLGEENGFHPG